MANDNDSQKPEKPALADRLLDIGGKIWSAAKPAFDHGRDELAAALFTGHTHVLYGHTGMDQPTQENSNQSPEVDLSSRDNHHQSPEVDRDMGLEL